MLDVLQLPADTNTSTATIPSRGSLFPSTYWPGWFIAVVGLASGVSVV